MQQVNNRARRGSFFDMKSPSLCAAGAAALVRSPMLNVTMPTHVTARRAEHRLLWALLALAQGFVEGDAAGDGGVERVDLSIHGQADQQVAVFAHQPTDALALVADDQGQGTGEIGPRVLCF